jgi:hypothetical protein
MLHAGGAVAKTKDKTKDLMLDCARRTLYVRGGEKVWDWKAIKVSDLDPSVSSPDIRCAHCHGKVRLHKRQVEQGPQDHVEHYSRADSEGCRAGHYFAGTHRLSASPVV